MTGGDTSAMTAAWWTLLGIVIGLVLALPIMRILLRRGERRARQAERRARNAERLAELGAMTSGLAHEIKNPLSTIGLNAQLLGEAIEDAALPEDLAGRLLRRLDTLRREVQRLSNILEDFLRFAGRIKLDAQPIDLARTVQDVADFYLPQAEQARVVLRVDQPGRPIVFPADEPLLKQALLNLMINATQAMTPRTRTTAAAPGGAGVDGGEPRGGDLILRVEADDAEARLHVIDTGPGIEPDRIEAIFRPYVSTKAGGTGLGLPTARRIAEEHGGRLEVQSEPGRGSRFTIHLPRANATHGEAGHASPR